MATPSIISSLPEDERDALALCGITQDAQLAAISPHRLLDDLRQAAEFFPERLRDLPTEARLQRLCGQAAAGLAAAGEEVSEPAPVPEQQPQAPRQHAHVAETAPHHHHGVVSHASPEDNGQLIKLAEAQPDTRGSDPRDFAHAVGCSSPLAIYFGAWVTLALVAACICLACVVYQLLIGEELNSRHLHCLYGMLGITALYFLVTHNARCSTCRIGIYSFRRYPRHRKAHHIPLLGYTLSTALSVIFLLRFRCPSCATPQKLLVRRRRRKH